MSPVTEGNSGSATYLDVSHLRADLTARTAGGGTVTVAAQLARYVLQLGITMVMGRLLLPSDYGTIAMVAAVTGFVGLFKDMGLSVATVQREDITEQQVSVLFWLNTLCGLILGLTTAGLAPAVAWFYRDSRLLWITLAFTPGFVVDGLAVQHRALLRRQMRFGALAVIDVVSLGLSGVACIGLGLAGAGYWALVCNVLLSSLVTTVALWSVCHWRPQWPSRSVGVGSMLALGGYLTGFQTLNYFARNLDSVLVGRVWGEQQLGLYSRAYSLLLLPMSMINAPLASVIVPALSRLQARGSEYKRLYLKVVALVAFVTMPLASFMVIASSDVITLILGSRWVEASTIFTLLGISALVQPIYNTQGWVHISLGRTDRMMRWGIVGSLAVVASFLVGLPFGARGVALSYSCAILLVTWPCLWYAYQPTEITLRALFGVICGPFVASLVAGGVAGAFLRILPVENSLLRVVLAFFLQVATYSIAQYVLPGGRARTEELRRYLQVYAIARVKWYLASMPGQK